MSADEIDSILRIQYMATHTGTPYQEDHYYQAYVYKLRGARPTRIPFAPATLRDITNPDANAHAAVRTLGIDGLGTIVLSNIRTPKMLMDLSSDAPPVRPAGAAKPDGSGSPAAPAVRPLEKEPLLAARMMIEDCMSLLLDIDDIDRTFAVAGPQGRADAADLRTRRWLLVKGIIASFRLPTHPVPSMQDATAPGADSHADGIFLRVMALPKGRSFLARTLRLLFPPTPSLEGALAPHAAMVLTVLWALLRNAVAVFAPATGGGGPDAANDMHAPSSRVCAAAAEVVRKLDSPDAVAQCLQALMRGSIAHPSQHPEGSPAAAGLLPLVPMPGEGDGAAPGGGQAEWLLDVLAALMLRASELGLSSGAGGVGEDEAHLRAEDASGGAVQLWGEEFRGFCAAMLRHLEVLAALCMQAQSQKDSAALASLRAMSPVQLVRTMLPHGTAQQQAALRAALSRVTTY